MPITIRDVREHELDSVVAVNNAAGPSILPMDLAKARFFWENAEYFRVAEQDGHVTGFLVALSQDAPHDSPNFLWFRERYPEFMYIDRIVIARPRRGGGRGRAMYADVQSFAEVRSPLLACEVFLQTGNDPALLFHGSFGFREVGQNVMPGSDIRASMLLKEMCSYPYVAETYGGRLPDLPWLRARPLPGRRPALATGT
ncbi:GNAT family N-acetyltransferase [Arenimonas caeni]|jgi:predicted GNAT superfamily acetyltransferase|uniref:GNAT family N-acetyltransferase n=1 Tax=Arenimonas caeni TaxID=2058085 RepID=A0A2P6M9V1_9GAMM|nr:GNAT family N-acetyltransferase [Arenimonas caeni]MDY0023230.1 GNAT family N-acetyltransferase [Arenimonas caeni]PRH82780.1 GNAT family N-acetyltransferase [Arenimonas caeni]